MPRPQRKSRKHRELFDLLKSLNPHLTIIEEYALRHNGKTYNIDLYVPQFSCAFEIQGAQHLHFSPFFHKTRSAFVKQQQRDVEKAFACEENGIRLLYVYPEDKLDIDKILSLVEGENSNARTI